MKITAFLNRVTVDELSMEAASVQAAVSELNTVVHRDENRTAEDVLRTRDYPAEYAEFMRFIYLARRALNQPDLPQQDDTP